MSALDQLAANDLVSNAVFEGVSLRPRKIARTGFTNICCPMCLSRGETADRRYRCGIIQGDGIGIKCFNCGFSTRWKLGDRVSKNMQAFLAAVGIDDYRIKRIIHWADQMRTMIAEQPEVAAKHNVSISLDFPAIKLPSSARSFQHLVEMDCDDSDFLAVADYLLNVRGDVVANATTYYWSPEPKFRHRLIIPCYHRKLLVGWIARSILPDEKQRYDKELPSNYLFNSRVMTIPDRKYLLITEGVFDALAIDAVGALGASLNEIQIAWIMQCGKQPVIVHDRDQQGLQLVGTALKHGWPVATVRYANAKHQWLESDIKDADQAAREYGKLYTVQSILANLTWDERQIRQRTNYQVSK